MRARRFLILLVSALASSGCAALEGAGLVRPAAPALEWTAEDAGAVSRHLVQALKLAYSTDTVFSLTGNSPLATAVEALLRESGYAIAAPADEAAADAVELTCTADVVNGAQGAGAVWAGLGVEGWRVDGLFVRGDDGRLGLSGGLTVRGR